MELLPRVGFKSDVIVGWYHSHPGFGCWLSFVDVKTQRSFEQLHKRAVAVVLDPVQSTGGRVVMDAFRCIDPMVMVMNREPRISTSVVGHLRKPTTEARLRGLDKLFYSMLVSPSANDPIEVAMLQNLRKSHWTKPFLKDETFAEE